MNCPKCQSQQVIKRGLDTLKDGTSLQRYRCKDCG
ncbi:MAG: IS1 family transposase, partial [Cyanobacteria bacterium P01_D01_bin.44]